jgi:hypothetical protein
VQDVGTPVRVSVGVLIGIVVEEPLIAPLAEFGSGSVWIDLTILAKLACALSRAPPERAAVHSLHVLRVSGTAKML